MIRLLYNFFFVWNLNENKMEQQTKRTKELEQNLTKSMMKIQENKKIKSKDNDKLNQ